MSRPGNTRTAPGVGPGSHGPTPGPVFGVRIIGAAGRPVHADPPHHAAPVAAHRVAALSARALPFVAALVTCCEPKEREPSRHAS